MTYRRPWLFAAGLLGLFALRLYFGLSSHFFAEDESQIFLIGLRYYATGHWPYFGPDVVWTMSEIPGALQGLLVGAPLALVPAPPGPGARSPCRPFESAVFRCARPARLVHHPAGAPCPALARLGLDHD